MNNKPAVLHALRLPVTLTSRIIISFLILELALLALLALPTHLTEVTVLPILLLAIFLSGLLGGLVPGVIVSILASFAMLHWINQHAALTQTSFIQVGALLITALLILILTAAQSEYLRALQKRRNLFFNLLESQKNIGEAIIVISKQEIIYHNHAFEKLLGVQLPESAFTSSLLELFPIDQQQYLRDTITRHQNHLPAPQVIQVSCQDTTSVTHQFEVRFYGENSLVFLYFRDITAQHEAEIILRRSEEHYRLLVENITDYAFFTLKRNGTIASWSEGAERIFGYREHEVIGRDLSHLLPDTNDGGLSPQHLKQAEEEGRVATEGWHRTKSGKSFYASGILTPLLNDQKQLRGYIAVVRDITERKHAEERIEHQALHDNLTSLPNRSLFRDRLESAIFQAQRHNEKFAVFFLDLDKFKNINDTLGHSAGDELLQEVGRRLTAAVRQQDTVARLGGDEFTIIALNCDQISDYNKVIKKIFASFEDPIIVEGHSLHVTTSIGIAIYPQDGENAETLVKNADIALYKAKAEGRNTYQLYAPTMNQQAGEKLKLENELRTAVEEDQLLLHYQPIYDLKTERVIGCESLVRWQHPEQGLLSPAMFIPLAEETGLIGTVNEWVLHHACAQNKKWLDADLPLRISVNISTHQFLHVDIADRIQYILGITKLPAELLDLEITEGSAMKNIELSVKRIQELKEMGLHISIDDFGTGHSSLNYLKQLPVDTLKIDRSFVTDCTQDKQDAEIIRAIVTIAHCLNLKTIAEGVETKAQLDYLKELHSDEVQGFFFSKPVPAQEFERLVRKNWQERNAESV